MISYFDLVVVVLVIGSGCWSAYRGLIREVFALLAVVVGIILAVAGYGMVMPLLENLLGTGWLARAVSFAVIFGVAVLAVVWLGYLLQKVVKVMLLGWADKVGGFVIGVLKGLLIIGMVLMMVDRIPAVHDEIQQYSRLSPWLIEVSRNAFELVPKIFARFTRDFT